MSVVGDIVVDSERPAAIARFWAEVLEGYAVAPYDDAELERLRAQGIDDPEDDPSVLVVGPPSLPRYFFTRVPEGKVVKNRVHFDLRAEDSASEVRRLIGLGARILAEYDGWTTMADPEGNEFCVLRH
ncbi:VOC family protein [Rathayibacter sp. CAU 1779]